MLLYMHGPLHIFARTYEHVKKTINKDLSVQDIKHGNMRSVPGHHQARVFLSFMYASCVHHSECLGAAGVCGV